MHLDAELVVQMFSQVLCGIDTAVLSAGAPEGEHEVSEATVDIALHVGVGKFVNAVEEGQNLAVVLQETYHGLIETGELLVRLVATGIVR